MSMESIFIYPDLTINAYRLRHILFLLYAVRFCCLFWYIICILYWHTAFAVNKKLWGCSMAHFRSFNGYRQFNSGSGWQFTHRAAAANKMGGAIKPGYHVHHINGVKTDNRYSNLTVIPASTHAKIHNK
ncbi:HNH endonuclease [anaerobic digester metagenome]